MVIGKFEKHETQSNAVFKFGALRRSQKSNAIHCVEHILPKCFAIYSFKVVIEFRLRESEMMSFAFIKKKNLYLYTLCSCWIAADGNHRVDT